MNGSIAYWLTLLAGISGFADTPPANAKVEGYRGIWFTLGQFSEHGDKYSGGLGTYTAKHVPLAVYAPEVEKTFFVFGGTRDVDERHLLAMVSYYDHANHRVPRPTIVHDKEGVNDPHDNPSIALDGNGHVWVFVSGRGRSRPGFKYRSVEPYSIDRFEQIESAELTYPQPWHVEGQGFLHLFTKYTSGRELYWERSPDGVTWTEDRKLAGMGGHYQVSRERDGLICTAFNYHPGGNVDRRTNLYFAQTDDMGETWTRADGQPLATPLNSPDSPALLIDYQAQGRLVYMKDLNFDAQGNPVILYITSNGHQPGPQNDPRTWMITRWTGSEWVTHEVCESDHNYDMGSLYISGDEWMVIGPTETGPQPYQTGGEIALWKSVDEGETWTRERQVTAGSPRNHGYVRRPVNAHDPFFGFWADGDPTEFSESHLYFTNSKGDRVWRLPYTMEGNFTQPLEVVAPEQ